MKILFRLVIDINICKRALEEWFLKALVLCSLFWCPSFVITPFNVSGNFCRYGFEKRNLNV